jgi:hypothetical protein
VPLSEKATVAATLATGDASLDAVLVFFYDGDPQQGGEAFDAELVSHIRAGETYVTRVKFQPRTCGSHTVVVVAGPATAFAATSTATVDVTIDPVNAIDTLTTATASFDLPTSIERSLLAKLKVARQAFEHNFPRIATNRLTAFIGEVEVLRGTTSPMTRRMA